MNIFVTHEHPLFCAKYLDDKRVIKMCLETAQMLSTAIHYLYGSEKALAMGLYKPTHVNHPCNVWVRQSLGNYIWARKHLYYLLKEYYARYGKSHACESILNALPFAPLVDWKEYNKTPFANCAANASLGVDFKNESNIFKAYKDYLTVRWDNDKRKPTWYGKEERPW